jgi:hypothetical protein
MASWVLVPCLVKLRSEFNTIAPRRRRASDGSVGDTAHQSSQSDHNPDETGNVPIRDADKTNEVHAIDVDADLRTPGLTMRDVVLFLVRRCRAGKERRLRYIIFDRRIWSDSDGWHLAGRAYTGANPHDKHAHFSSVYDSQGEASTTSWHLQEVLPVTAPTADQNAAAVAAKDIDPGPGTYSLGGGIWTALQRTGYLNQLPGDLAQLATDLNARVQDVDDELDGLGASLAFLSALIGQITNEPGTDPNVWYDVVRKAVADELDARATVAPTE